MSDKERLLTAFEIGFVPVLFEEAIDFYELEEEEIAIGKTISIFSHGEGVYSLHFRRNLDKLKGNGLKRVKAFMEQIGSDLGILASLLNSDSSLEPELRRFPDFEKLYGLTPIFKGWGKRHGFEVIPALFDPELIRAHQDNIIGDPENDNDNPAYPKEMYLFVITREGIIENFLPKE